MCKQLIEEEEYVMSFISSLINGGIQERSQVRNLQFQSHENSEDRKLERHKVDSYYDFAKTELASKERQFNTMHQTFNNIFEKISPMLANLAKPVPDFLSSIGKGMPSPFDACNKFCAGGMAAPFSPKMLSGMKF